MSYYLILCRSVTYAQRTAKALGRVGISAYMLRAPASISTEGCSHCVRVAHRDLAAAMNALRRSGLTPKHVFAALPEGGYREVTYDLP